MGVVHRTSRRRAWILQEQLLAPRTLYFGKDQIFWECRRRKASEVWLLGTSDESLPSEKHGKTKNTFDIGELLPDEQTHGYSENDRDLLFVRWRRILTLYTDRSLTYRKDKFSALSGIANVLKEKLQSEYMEGLWWENLTLDLAWHVAQDCQSTKLPSDNVTASWSWASTDGRIEYDGFGKHTIDMKCMIHHSPHRAYLPLPFSTPKLDISGLTYRTTWHENTQRSSIMCIHDETSSSWFDAEIELYSDILPPTPNLPQPITLLQLCRLHCIQTIGSRYGRRRMQGLVLASVNEQDPVYEGDRVYRRVGAWRAVDFGYTKIAEEGWSRFVDGWTWRRVVIE